MTDPIVRGSYPTETELDRIESSWRMSPHFRRLRHTRRCGAWLAVDHPHPARIDPGLLPQPGGFEVAGEPASRTGAYANHGLVLAVHDRAGSRSLIATVGVVATVEVVVAELAEEIVIVVTAHDSVGAPLSNEVVPSRVAKDPVAACIAKDRVPLGASMDRVRVQASHDEVLTRVAAPTGRVCPDVVPAATAVQRVLTVSPDHVVGAAPTPHLLALATPVAPQGVCATTTSDEVLGGSAVDLVVTVPPTDSIAPAATPDDVVAATGNDDVVLVGPPDSVIAGRAHDRRRLAEAGGDGRSTPD